LTGKNAAITHSPPTPQHGAQSPAQQNHDMMALMRDLLARLVGVEAKVVDLEMLGVRLANLEVRTGKLGKVVGRQTTELKELKEAEENKSEPEKLEDVRTGKLEKVVGGLTTKLKELIDSFTES
jgi:hypothetical protein